MKAVCPDCGYEAASMHGLKVHKGRLHKHSDSVYPWDLPAPEPAIVMPGDISGDSLVELLSDDEFDMLSEGEQQRYLALLRAEAEEWKLTPRQQRAEELAHQVDELFYGGAMSGGKSIWILWHAYHLSLKYPGHHSLLLRRTFPMLRRTLILKSWMFFNPDDGCRWRAADKQWLFDNGSLIEFGHCATLDDTYNYMSAEYDVIMVDEATEMLSEQWEMLRTRNRCSVEKRNIGIWPHMVGAGNPGGRSHRYFKDRFVTPYYQNGEQEVFDEPIIDDETGEQAVGEDGSPLSLKLAFVPSTVYDNPHQDADYRRRLEGQKGTRRRMYLLGDWDVFEGQYFPEFSRESHVIADFDVPDDWVRFRGLDYGRTDPFACLWAAVDPEGFIVVYREAYQAGLNISEQTDRVNTLSGTERISYTMADPSVFHTIGGKDGSMYRQYVDSGFPMPLRPANNDRLAGWNRVREFLAVEPDVDPPPWAQKPPGKTPRLFVMASCRNLIRTIPEMQHDENRPEDLDTDQEDHLVDALRYMLMSRPAPSSKRQLSYGESISQQFRRIARQARKPAERIWNVGQ